MALRAKQVAYETDVRVWRGAVSSSQDRIQELEKKVFELTREVNFVKVYLEVLERQCTVQ
jgi:hypothetical protein